MKKDPKISVAMTVFNGERYLKDQISSILVQLKKNDELVVSVDESSDDSFEILKQYSDKDSRIKLIKGPNEGVVKNFEKAILNCTGDYIFLSDQDDLWEKGKILKVSEYLNNESVDLVLHDAKVADKDLNVIYESFFDLRKSKSGVLKNIFKNSYIGCCMAFKNKLKEKILPFPKNIPMHDQWIGLIAEKYGKVKFLKEPLIIYRRHEQNKTELSHSSFKNMIKWRINIIKNLIRPR